MTGSRLSPDAERELRDLRIRAYGPNPDIGSDPAALARLAELEDAHASARPSVMDIAPPVAAVESLAVTAPATTTIDTQARPLEPTAVLGDGGAGTAFSGFISLRERWQRATSTRPGRLGVTAGAIVVALSLVYAIVWVVTPHPDAILQATGHEPDAQLIRLLPAGSQLKIDVSSLRSYETYRGLEPWSGVDAWGNPCLIILERTTDKLIAAECMPREAALLADAAAWPYWHDEFARGLPDASLVRFHLDGDTVEAFLHLAPEAE